MKLLDAILSANQRMPRGSSRAELVPAECADALPLVALTCLDARLNHCLPEVLGIPEEKFIWLRNAGNIITGPLSSTMRSLALACAIKGGKEIAVIGHSDCQVCKTSMLKLTDAFKAFGIERHQLPENLTEYFGLFASERQNVLRGAETIRGSPLIGSKVPVHGLMLDLASGGVEVVVNGYQTIETAASHTGGLAPVVRQVESVVMETLANLPEFKVGEMKFPEAKIGEGALDTNKWLSEVKRFGAEALGSREVQAEKGAPGPESTFDKARHYKVIGSDQKVYGPINGLKILQWITEGRIHWDTPSQVEGSGEWRPLAKWADLIQRLPKSKPPRLPGA